MRDIVVAVPERSDVDLLTSWQGGEARAGELLARRYFSVLRGYFVTKAPLDYEDLVSNTLLRLVHKRDSFRAQSSFRTYLFGIARMILLEHFRARQRDQRFDPMESSAADHDSGRMSSLLSANEHHRLLFDALRTLELRDQELLELYYWQQLSAREVGEVLEVSETSVRTRLRTALRRLAKEYAQLSAQPHERSFDDDLVAEWMQGMRAELDDPSIGPRVGRR